MKIIKFVLLNIVFLIFFACNRNEKKVEIEQIITEWKGKEIHFPNNYNCNFLGRDTIMQLCLDLFRSEYKVLLYVDSVGCGTMCWFLIFHTKQWIWI